MAVQTLPMNIPPKAKRKMPARKQRRQDIFQARAGRSITARHDPRVVSGFSRFDVPPTPEGAADTARLHGFDLPPSTFEKYLPQTAQMERAAGQLAIRRATMSLERRTPPGLIPTGAERGPEGKLTTEYSLPPATLPSGFAPISAKRGPEGRLTTEYKPPTPEISIPETLIPTETEVGGIKYGLSPPKPKPTRSDIGFYTERGFSPAEAKNIRDGFWGIKEEMPQTPKEISMEISRWQTIQSKTREFGLYGQFGDIRDQETFDLATTKINELSSLLAESEIIVVDGSGNEFYLPQNELQEAEKQGYRIK